MFTSQIIKALSSDVYAQRHFLGVYPSDKLPVEIKAYPASVVANTDPAHKPGTHWIAFYFDQNKHLDYFDSYGAPPTTYPELARFAAKNCSTLSFNNRQLQAFHTDVCGQYCIAFIAMRSRGFSLEYIMNYYSSQGRSAPGAHDNKVRSEVDTFYKIKSIDSRGRGRNVPRSHEQCCCSAV